MKTILAEAIVFIEKRLQELQSEANEIESEWQAIWAVLKYVPEGELPQHPLNDPEDKRYRAKSRRDNSANVDGWNKVLGFVRQYVSTPTCDTWKSIFEMVDERYRNYLPQGAEYWEWEEVNVFSSDDRMSIRGIAFVCKHYSIGIEAGEVQEFLSEHSKGLSSGGFATSEPFLDFLMRNYPGPRVAELIGRVSKRLSASFLRRSIAALATSDPTPIRDALKAHEKQEEEERKRQEEERKRQDEKRRRQQAAEEATKQRELKIRQHKRFSLKVAGVAFITTAIAVYWMKTDIAMLNLDEPTFLDGLLEELWISQEEYFPFFAKHFSSGFLQFLAALILSIICVPFWLLWNVLVYIIVGGINVGLQGLIAGIQIANDYNVLPVFVGIAVSATVYRKVSRHKARFA